MANFSASWPYRPDSSSPLLPWEGTGTSTSGSSSSPAQSSQTEPTPSTPSIPSEESTLLCSPENKAGSTFLQCLSQEAYPRVCVQGSNRTWSNLLSRVYAGPSSELTKLLRYEYQSLILEQDYPLVGQELREMSRNDMEHLDLVGQLIVLLGGDPIFGVIARQGVNWWRGGLIPRNQTARQALTYDIRAQEEAIRTYRQLMLLISDPNIDALLRRILADEQCQLQVLRSLLSTL